MILQTLKKSFSCELALKNTESAIKNELKDLFSELGELKFETKLVLEFKKIEGDDLTRFNTFHSISKQKQLLMKAILMMYLNQSIVRFYQTYKNHLEKVSARLLIRL